MLESSDYHVAFTVIATVAAIRICDAVVHHFSLTRQRRTTLVAASIDDTAATINYVDDSMDDNIINEMISAPSSVVQFVALVVGAVVASRLYDIVFRSPRDRLEIGSVADVIVTAVLTFNFGIIIGSVLIAVRAHDFLVRFIDETVNGGGFSASAGPRAVYTLSNCDSSPKNCTPSSAQSGGSAVNDDATVETSKNGYNTWSVHGRMASTVGTRMITEEPWAEIYNYEDDDDDAGDGELVKDMTHAAVTASAPAVWSHQYATRDLHVGGRHVRLTEHALDEAAAACNNELHHRNAAGMAATLTAACESKSPGVLHSINTKNQPKRDAVGTMSFTEAKLRALASSSSGTTDIRKRIKEANGPTAVSLRDNGPRKPASHW